MKNFIIDTFNIGLPILYALLLLLYARSFFYGNGKSGSYKSAGLIILIIFHTIYLSFRTLEFNHPPITTPFEIMTVIALCISIAYLYLELISKVHGTGFFILLPAFFFQLISSIFIKDLGEVPEILRSNLLGFHVSSALLGYAAIATGAMYGILYLMLYHKIKSRQFDIIYKRLPNLETLESMSFKATFFGFIMLSIAIFVGIIWLPIAFGEIFYSDPKLIGTFAIWILYAVGLTTKKLAGWHGRKTIVLYVTGFLIAIFSITFINSFFSSFHQFY